MALTVNTNVYSINAQKNLSRVTDRLAGNYRRLSSGLRIASAADDAAGLAISERFRAQIRSLQRAQLNANDGISIVQTAEGALNEVSSMLVRMRELAIQANNGSVSGADKDSLQLEFSSLISEIDRIAQATKFNNVQLLDGTTSTMTLQVGEGITSNVDTITLSLSNLRTATLGIDSSDIGSSGSATTAITAIDTAIDTVTSARGQFGAVMNRLQATINNLGVSIENISAAESRVRDVDIAFETADLTRNSIMQQAALSILAQTNVQPQIALALLQ
ncbi:MAG: flagellin N-terminal helical domain-containing protein [Planctomycetota bacterium]|jgi:flagellin